GSGRFAPSRPDRGAEMGGRPLPGSGAVGRKTVSRMGGCGIGKNRSRPSRRPSGFGAGRARSVGFGAPGCGGSAGAEAGTGFSGYPGKRSARGERLDPDEQPAHGGDGPSGMAVLPPFSTGGGRRSGCLSDEGGSAARGGGGTGGGGGGDDALADGHPPGGLAPTAATGANSRGDSAGSPSRPSAPRAPAVSPVAVVVFPGGGAPPSPGDGLFGEGGGKGGAGTVVRAPGGRRGPPSRLDQEAPPRPVGAVPRGDRTGKRAKAAAGGAQERENPFSHHHRRAGKGHYAAPLSRAGLRGRSSRVRCIRFGADRRARGTRRRLPAGGSLVFVRRADGGAVEGGSGDPMDEPDGPPPGMAEGGRGK